MKLSGENLVEATSTSTKMVDLLVVNDLDIPAYATFHVFAEVAARDEFREIETCLKINEQEIARDSGRAFAFSGPLRASGRVNKVTVMGRTTSPKGCVMARSLSVYLEDDT
mgnify:FL=1